jgi:hypothetical protein
MPRGQAVRLHTKEELRMRQIIASRRDGRVLDPELLADPEGDGEDARFVGPKDDPPPPPSPSLRYRPFERLAARLRSN